MEMLSLGEMFPKMVYLEGVVRMETLDWRGYDLDLRTLK